jgi:hypothetical protein
MEKTSLLFVQSMVAAAVETLNGLKKVLAEMENAPQMPAAISMPNFNEMLSGLAGTPLMKPDMQLDTPQVENKSVGDRKRMALTNIKGNAQPYISMPVISPKIKNILSTKESLSLGELMKDLERSGDIPDVSKKTKSYVSTALSLMKKRQEVERSGKYKGSWKLTKPEASARQQENSDMEETLPDNA